MVGSADHLEHDYRARAGRTGARELWALFGVDEDNGAYVIVIGIIFISVAVIGCCYCKVYDPTRKWCKNKYKKWCTKKDREALAPPPDRPPTPEVSRNALDRTVSRRDIRGPYPPRCTSYHPL